MAELGMWIALAIVGLLFAYNYWMKNNAKGDRKKYENHMMECMCLGLCFGIVFTGGVVYAMLVGTVVGMFWKKTKTNTK